MYVRRKKMLRDRLIALLSNEEICENEYWNCYYIIRD